MFENFWRNLIGPTEEEKLEKEAKAEELVQASDRLDTAVDDLRKEVRGIGKLLDDSLRAIQKENRR